MVTTVDENIFEAELGHEQKLSLVAGFAFEGDGIIAGKRRSKSLADQADFARGADAVNRPEKDGEDEEDEYKDDGFDESWKRC